MFSSIFQLLPFIFPYSTSLDPIWIRISYSCEGPCISETGGSLPQPGGRLRQPERLPREDEEHRGREEEGAPRQRQDGHHASLLLQDILLPGSAYL